MMADDSLVLVTGASGYIATHVIQQLQQAGYRVRGTVRSTKDEDKVKPLKELCPDAKYPLELVEADLTKSEGWTEAVKGSKYVIHVASPVLPYVPSDENEIIKPAVDGTLNVLKACKEAGGVKRVVLTSSTAAVSNGMDQGGDHVFTEADWTDVNNVKTLPYTKSKVMAEKAAWDYVSNLPDAESFELSVMNPAVVFGPLLTSQVSTSIIYPRDVIDSKMPMVPNVNCPLVDVRDVAKAHVVAMTLHEAAGHRHCLVNESIWAKDMAIIWDKELRPLGYNVPTRVAPDFLLKFASIFMKPLQLITPSLGKVTKIDNTRMKSDLGIEPIKVQDTLIDMAYSLIEKGCVRKTPQYKARQAKQENIQTAVTI